MGASLFFAPVKQKTSSMAIGLDKENGAYLYSFGADGKLRMEIGESNGEYFMKFKDNMQTDRMILGIFRGKSDIFIADDQGKLIWSAP